MEQAPVPRHERTWRHPSEVAAEERELIRAEPTPVAARVLAITTGSIGLLAIALLVFTVTPGHQAAPVAVEAATTIVARVDRAPAAIGIAGVRRSTAPETSISAKLVALATPVGDGRFAFVSTAAVDDAASIFDVVLPSGVRTQGVVIDRSGETVVVELEVVEPGHDVAEARPGDREIVTVMASPPITVAYADLGSLDDVAEGTAVLDDDGDLVGLCSEDDDGTRLIEIDADDVPGDDGSGDAP